MNHAWLTWTSALERGLVERFDGSIGAGSVLMPFGGKYQLTPTQVMARTMPALNGHVRDLLRYGASALTRHFTDAEPVSRRCFRGHRVRGKAGRCRL